MKKYFRMILLFAMTVSLLLCGSASANSWGLTGKLYQAVERSKAWDDYTTLSNQAGPFAVMKTRYHHALFHADNSGELHVYTAAVYPPEDKRQSPSLSLDGQDLHIVYGEQEKYVFRALSEERGYQLYSAEIGSFRLNGNWESEKTGIISYEANEDGRNATWPVTVRLADFNIKLLPRSVEEIRNMNLVRAQMSSGMHCLGSPGNGLRSYSPDEPGTLLQPKKKGTAPVYSAPYGKSAWRSGKGKAAVGMNGSLWILSFYKNEDGKSYACIRYNVSERTQRIGYALCRDLGLPEITDWEPDDPMTGFAHVDVETTANTWLTDDPDVSQYQQFTVPKGTLFSCMGLYNDYYAYVAAEVKKEKFTDGGAIVWGFVPVRDLKPMEQEKQPEAMDRLTGSWRILSGGSMADDYLVLNDDGSFSASHWNWRLNEPDRNGHTDSGTWYVTKYNSFMNLYQDNPPWQLTLIYDDGRAGMFGLEITENGIILTDAEIGGEYEPVTEEVRLTENRD